MPTTAEHLRTALDGAWHDARQRARTDLADPAFAPHYTPDLEEARAITLKQMKILAERGYAASGFSVESGGTGDPGGAVASIEMLAMSDLSLMVKAGVQWGLFGGAIENLGTERHHKEYIRPLIDLDLLGCFAMTETGHGSDVQALETTATYDPATQEFVVHSPTPSSRKDYIGGAAQHAKVAAVFAQLITGGESHGVHCFVVPIRDEDGNDLPGVTTSDCGHKGGLPGVDNGRIMFDSVRIPRENLLNKYSDVEPDGTYVSDIDNPSRRFFTMVGTLVRGRITVGGSAGAAARVALTIATQYAEKRRQFDAPGREAEVPIMDYLVHQRRLLPLIARSYALGFAQNELLSTMNRLQSMSLEDLDPQEQRELEGRAAGLKVAHTWHASRAIQECREACGGAGYMAENRLTALRERAPLLPLDELVEDAKNEADRIVGLELGADDYITKPFNLRELVLRVGAVLRRSRGERGRSKVLGFAGLRLDPAARIVTVDGDEIHVTGREFDLLHFLLTNPNRVFSRSDLLRQVWEYDFEGYDRTVDAHVARLRRKLGPPGEWIETAWGIGYKFHPPAG